MPPNKRDGYQALVKSNTYKAYIHAQNNSQKPNPDDRQFLVLPASARNAIQTNQSLITKMQC